MTLTNIIENVKILIVYKRFYDQKSTILQYFGYEDFSGYLTINFGHLVFARYLKVFKLVFDRFRVLNNFYGSDDFSL